jgi:probable F420-dependent oxidoreductase
MRFMYVYPEMGGTEHDMLDAGPIGEVAATAEAAGFGGFAFTEHPSPGARWLEAGGHQSLDPFVALAFVAAATTDMKLLTYLSVLPYRNPLLLAKTTATLDKLSGGRFILGVGAGYLRGEFKALGVDFEERNALFDEALDVLPMHWSGEPFSYKGTHFEAKECIGRPTPVQQPIPIWIGGSAERALRRAAVSADGLFPQRPLDGKDWAGTLEQLREWAVDAGRDWSRFGLDQRISIAEPDPGAWVAVAEEWIGLGATHLTLVTMGGGLDDVDAHLERLREGLDAVRGVL